MISSIINLLQVHIIPLGAMGVFIASVLEEILAPVPSAFVQLGAGFLFVHDLFSLSSIYELVCLVVLPAALGVTVGSLFVYGIAYFFGKPALMKWGKWLGLSWADVERAQTKFEKNSAENITLFITRSVPVIPSVAISALAGLMRMPLKNYFIFTFLGTCVRATVLAIIGSEVGALYVTYIDLFKTVENFVLLLLILAGIVFVVWRLYVRSRARGNFGA